MAHSKTAHLKHVFLTVKSSILPALLFAAALLFFFAQNPFEFGLSQVFHWLFLACCGFTLALLALSNRTKPFFSTLLGLICYLSVNWLKNRYGADYLNRPEFLCLCFIFPLNFVVFYFLPQQRLNSAYTRWVILTILAQMLIIEHFGSIITVIPYLGLTWNAMPLWAAVLWFVMLAPLVINICFKNTILNTGLFYADSALFLGLIFSYTASGLSIFFLAFGLILLLTTLLSMRHRYRFDYLDHVGSHTAYLSHANHKFPFKYTVGIYQIDNRDKLLEAVGGEKLVVLEQMIVDKILEIQEDIEIYRYNENELIMVFKNQGAKQTEAMADNIRHTIAAAEFIFSNKKSLKLTISVCVSEKTRKDIDATEVIERAHAALQKNAHFNSNITTKAV